MRRIIAAVAAAALAAGAAYGQGSGRGNDKDNEGRGNPAAGASQSDRGNNGNRGRSNANNDRSMAASMRESDNRSNRGGNAQRGNRGNEQRAERATQRPSTDDRGRGNDNRAVVADRRGGDRGDGGDFDFIRLGGYNPIDGCPPGLAKKNNGCRPPGQVRQDDRLFGYFEPEWWGMPWLGDGRYFYRDGYLLRLDDGGIGGYIPLLGGALGIGNPWPSYYDRVRVPDYYVDYYDLGPYDSYRYADDVIYRVDPQTSAITSIAALLTGDEFVVGQPMPPGYDVYNVPWGYRDRYYDTADAWYRYGDGRIYQVDPETRLIAAVIELIAN